MFEFLTQLLYQYMNKLNTGGTPLATITYLNMNRLLFNLLKYALIHLKYALSWVGTGWGKPIKNFKFIYYTYVQQLVSINSRFGFFFLSVYFWYLASNIDIIFHLSYHIYV